MRTMRLRAMCAAILVLLIATSCRNEFTLTPPADGGAPVPAETSGENTTGNPGGYPGVAYPYETDPDFPEVTQDVDAAYATAVGYWQGAAPGMFGIEYAAPQGYVLYERTGEASCAGQPLETGNAFFCPPDNTVSLDIGLLLARRKSVEGDVFTYFAVFHEVAHSMQHQIGQFDSPNALVIGTELQADCMAGAAMQDLTEQGVLIEEAGDQDELVASLFAIRDMPGVPYFDPSAHGTAAQRIKAVQDGQGTDPVTCVDAYPPEFVQSPS